MRMNREQMEAHLRLHGWYPGIHLRRHIMWGKEGVISIGVDINSGALFYAPSEFIHPNDDLYLPDNLFLDIYNDIIERGI